jgi:hypothetical protein
MSTILKALRKLEEEQRVAAPRDLPGQILAERAAAPRRAHSALLVGTGVAGGLLLALLVGVGVHWLQGDAPEGSPPPRVAPAASVAESSGPLAVQAEEHPSARPVEARAGGSPVASGTDLRHGSAPGAAIQDVSAPASRPVAATIREAPARRGSMLPAGKEPAVAQVSVASPVLPPPGAVMTAPHLRVTEIFPAVATGGRMALVNGLPVMEGTRVDDALVKEVRAGEVLFEIDGRSVAVPLRPGE